MQAASYDQDRGIAVVSQGTMAGVAPLLLLASSRLSIEQLTA